VIKYVFPSSSCKPSQAKRPWCPLCHIKYRTRRWPAHDHISYHLALSHHQRTGVNVNSAQGGRVARLEVGLSNFVHQMASVLFVAEKLSKRNYIGQEVLIWPPWYQYISRGGRFVTSNLFWCRPLIPPIIFSVGDDVYGTTTFWARNSNSIRILVSCGWQF
jgi:hypothetical protein